MMQFYLSYKQVKHDYSLPRTYAVRCGRCNITVHRDYLHAQNQGKLASVCLQRFSLIFETIYTVGILMLALCSASWLEDEIWLAELVMWYKCVQLESGKKYESIRKAYEMSYSLWTLV